MSEVIIDSLVRDKYKNDIQVLCKLNSELLNLPKEFARISRIITQNNLDIDFKEINKELRFGSGYYVIRNLPMEDSLPETPKDGFRPLIKHTISEAIILGVISALDYRPFSYTQEKGGMLIHEIAPVKEKQHSTSSNGTVELGFHTDAAYLERNFRPNILALYCLKNTCQTATEIVQLSTILAHLTILDIYELMQKNYTQSPPYTFSDNKPVVGAILTRESDRIEIALSSHEVKGLTPKAQKALHKLKVISQKHSIPIDAKPADLIIFNNLRCLHGRGEIQGDRWLQRCYGSDDLLPIQSYGLDRHESELGGNLSLNIKIGG